jgi:hypothetical protein
VLEDNAVVFTRWEKLYPYYFVAHVEQGRKDIRVHELYPKGNMDGIAQSTIEYVKRDFKEREFYFEFTPSEAITGLEEINKYFEVELVDIDKPIYKVTGIK